MTITNSIALFFSIVLLALIPSVSVLTVSLRSVSYGFIHGLITTLGIILGDIIFILIAIYGLTFFSQNLGNFFVGFKFLGGAYLIYLGISLWKSKSENIINIKNNSSSLLASFFIGFFVTLADVKAIFFYLSFLPAFVNLSTISILDTLIIILIAIIGVGIVKLTYAFMGDKTSNMLKKFKLIAHINKMGATLIMGIGLFLILR